jgi:hypothetical protein
MLHKIIVHSDWSITPKKRWMCVALLEGNTYRLLAPEPVINPGKLVQNLVYQAKDGGVMLGFDFPIGFPKSYADRADIDKFIDVLPELGSGQWRDFFKLAERPEEISIYRPFYPFRPGGTQHSQLVEGLKVESFPELLRRCELGNEKRNDACSLFWTLGANQVGRAAISGWQEILIPSLKAMKTDIAIWPFDVQLDQLTEFNSAVIVETYPGDACVQIGLGAAGRGWSKRNKEHRISKAQAIKKIAREMELDIKPIEAAIDDGFGNSDVGEDQFDALIGLLGMLSVVLGIRDTGLPDDKSVTTVEGWIFGQKSN